MAWALDPEETEVRTMHGLVDFKGKDVLEIGCGNGRLTWRYADGVATVLALDPQEPAIKLAQEHTPETLRSRVTFQVADITTIDLSEDAFDIALLSWSLC
ncbi:MAG: class I SAM-dependent methyltransferase [Chloroflexota bacterium]|nr:class I SAM-dependent methyltransferase [Chloroflexota bacterium]